MRTAVTNPLRMHTKYFFLSFVLLIIYFLMRDPLTDMFAACLFQLFPAPWTWIRALRVSTRPLPLGTTLYTQ